MNAQELTNITFLTEEEKARTAIIKFSDTGKTKVTTYRTVEEMINDANLALFVGASVCIWFSSTGWVWR